MLGPSVDLGSFTEIGTGDEPNQEAIAGLNPDLILAEVLSDDLYPTLSEIAQTGTPAPISTNRQERPAEPARAVVSGSRVLLRPAILVLLHEHNDHGYSLMERLGQAGLGRVDPAGVDRALRVLEDEGSARSWWTSAEPGPPAGCVR